MKEFWGPIQAKKLIEFTHDGIVANGVSRDKEGKSYFRGFTSLPFFGN
jgi:hypothetical protein